MDREESLKLSDAILSLFKEDVSLPNLATLARFVSPGDERFYNILPPLVAKLDEARTPAEVG